MIDDQHTTNTKYSLITVLGQQAKDELDWFI